MGKKGNETVLVVDDDSLALDLIELMIAPLGYKVILAESGEEALEVAENNGGKIDLLLTDIMLPGLTGLDLVKQFIKKYPKTKILFMSGYLCPSVAHQDVAHSEKAFVLKPFTTDTLAKKMRAVLQSNYFPVFDDEDDTEGILQRPAE
jgi:two-component system cell cycle sensor histidine kinase/response regulator CckA